MGFAGTFGLSMVKCSSSNGREPDSVDGVKSVERLLEEKRRAELSARIASGEFTVEKTGYTYYKLNCGFSFAYVGQFQLHFIKY